MLRFLLFSLVRSRTGRAALLWTVLAPALSARAQVAPLSPGRAARPPRVIHVPSQSPTIQGAIDRALDGDVVIVAPGTYVEMIDFSGKAIEVIGTEGPARTTIRVPGTSPVVLFRSGEGPKSRLMGFTISGGGGDYTGEGGGISCSAFPLVTSPYISDCIIERNSTDFIWQGYGAAGVHGNPILERCVLRQNNTYHFAGGAVEGVVTMLQCVVEDNWSCEGGGGLRLLPGSFVQDCIVQRNSAGPCGYHGIVYTSLGGGVRAEQGPVELIGCVLRENWVDEYPDPSGDCASVNRGGTLDAGNGVTLRRCTIARNRAEQCAVIGGILGSPTLIDCIVRDNEDPPGYYAAQSSFRFTDVEGGAAGPGCFDADPLFVDAGAGDLRLRDGSPCIDAGDPASPLDPDGTRADLGAFHHPAAAAPLAASWRESARLQPSPACRFGASVAVEGDTALVGAQDYYACTDSSAFVFRRSGAGWSEEMRLTASDAQPGDGFGAAVALEANAAVVAAPRHDTIGGWDGAVYVFERSAPGAPFVETVRLLPSIQQRDGLFGRSVALDSGFLVVGELGTDSYFPSGLGHVFVFQRSARGAWQEVAVLTAPPYISSLYGPSYGDSVAISGTTIVVGAPYFEADYQVPGRAFVYERAGATPHSWVQTAVLEPTGTRGYGNFGSTVSVSGDVIIIGSNFGAYAYERNGPGLPWSRATRIGPFEPTAVLVQGNRAWLRRSSGEIRELVQPSEGAPWSEVARFPSPPGPLAADGSTLLAGAPGEDYPTGAVHVFARGVQVDSVGLDQAADEEEVVLRGLELDSVVRVLVGGVEEPIVRQGETELVLRPARRDPGFSDLTLESLAGAFTLPGAFASLPTLAASHTGIGGTLEVELVNGTAGFYELAWSLDLRPTPLVVHSPPTWYAFLLQLLPGRSGYVDGDAFTNAGSVAKTFLVPDDPALAGATVHLQALCRRGLFGAGRYSFTNLASLQF